MKRIERLDVGNARVDIERFIPDPQPLEIQGRFKVQMRVGSGCRRAIASSAVMSCITDLWMPRPSRAMQAIRVARTV